jgi:hypothetical protein
VTGDRADGLARASLGALAPGALGERRGHGHTWSLVRFELAGGHPYAVRACRACGAEQRIRAWEREWDPADAATSGTRHPVAARRAEPGEPGPG